MKIINLDVFLWRFKRVRKIAINNTTCFKISSALPYTICNGYNTSCTNIVQDLTLGNQQSTLSNVIVKYSSRIQNNFLYVSHPRIISHITLYNGRKHFGYKTYYGSQHYNSIRCLSNTSIDSIAKDQVQMQFSGIFKAISESAPVKITQDSLLLVHDYTGLPWWSIIILTTIMMRTTVTLPLFLYQVESHLYPL